MRAEASRWHDLSGRLDELQAEPVLCARGGVLPHHTYPGRDEDLKIMRRYHGERGVPPAGFFARLLWRLRVPPFGGAS